jgi:TolA-binding protein
MAFFKKIDAYLDGELTGSELSSFLDEMKHNSELAKEVELYKNVNTLLQDKAADDSKRKDLEKLHEEFMNSRSKSDKNSVAAPLIIKRNRSRKFYYAVAAGLAIFIIASGIYFFMKYNSYSNQKIFAAYYMPYEYSSATRGVSDDKVTKQDPFDKGLEQYEAANYSAAIPFFLTTLLEDTVAYGADFFVGICYIETDQYNKALTSFQKIISSKSIDYSEEAHWYLGLCYLKTENKLKAIEQFKFLIQNSSYYKSKSEEILSKIEKQN